jgi:2-succinyl-6-hydroxy-2,4-cyclohexadiene-1-carboxylate synthase
VELREVDVGPVVLAVAEAGRGGAPLLLVHGFTGAKEDFADWVDGFAGRGFHVVAPDLRGHGSSSKPDDEASYSLSHMADDVVGLADALGWSRFALLGHSMGGMVVQHVALRAGARLSALVLMDTSPSKVSIDPDLIALAVSVVRSEGIERLMELQAERDAPLATAADARVRAEREGYIEFGDRKMRASSPAMYAAMATELVERDDLLPELAGLDVPTLVVVGEQDEPFLAPSRAMADTIPGARLEVLADAGHSPQFESPERWWGAVETFLTEVTGPRP